MACSLPVGFVVRILVRPAKAYRIVAHTAHPNNRSPSLAGTASQCRPPTLPQQSWGWELPQQSWGWELPSKAGVGSCPRKAGVGMRRLRGYSDRHLVDVGVGQRCGVPIIWLNCTLKWVHRQFVEGQWLHLVLPVRSVRASVLDLDALKKRRDDITRRRFL